jgi:hypothetical protein
MTPTRIRALITTIILGIVAGCALAYYIYSTNMPNIPESAIVIPPVVEQIEQENSEVHNEQSVSQPGEVIDVPSVDSGNVGAGSEPYNPSEPTTPPSDPTVPGPTGAGGCFVGGCSGQLCTGASDIASTCEWREEYACYAKAICERQATGECGWTSTAPYAQCVASARGGEIVE